MNFVEIKVISNEGQPVSGSVFFSLSQNCDNVCNEKGRINQKTMEKKEIILSNSSIYKLIANYAYDLFQIFDNKYKAAPIKVQKLLFIAEMVSIYRYNESLFPDDIIFECNACGFKIPTFAGYIKNFISNGEIENKVIVPTHEETVKIKELQTEYILEKLNPQTLEIIKNTVIAFGSFSPVTLGELLNDFKDNSQSITFKKQPPFTFYKNDFVLLLQNLKNLEGKNAIADFILNYDQKSENSN